MAIKAVMKMPLLAASCVFVTARIVQKLNMLIKNEQ